MYITPQLTITYTLRNIKSYGVAKEQETVHNNPNYDLMDAISNYHDTECDKDTVTMQQALMTCFIYRGVIEMPLKIFSLYSLCTCDCKWSDNCTIV